MTVTVVDFRGISRQRFLGREAAKLRHPSTGPHLNPPSGPTFPGDRPGLDLVTGDTAQSLDRAARRRTRPGAERGAGKTLWEGSPAPLEASDRGGVA